MQLGIIVDALDISHKSLCLLKQLNKFDQLDKHVDPIVFYDDFKVPLLTPKFATMQHKYMWAFNSTLMATNLNTADKLIKCISPKRKLFYMWDLEWIHKSVSLDTLVDIYLHDNIELVARSKEHYDIIKYCWKTPICIVEDFNYEQLAEICA